MVRVLVDGDACPVKDEISQLYLKYHFDWWIFIDVSHILEIDEAHVIYCDKQRDSADLMLMKEAKKDDIVVTSDLGLAAYALARGCLVIDFNGRYIVSEAIDALLMERAINQKDRRQKKFTKRPKARTKKDDEAFYVALEKLLEDKMNIEELKIKQQENEKCINKLGLFRLLALLGMLLCFISAAIERKIALGIFGILLLIVFLYFMQKQNQAKENIQHILIELDIKEKILARKQGQYSHEKIQYDGPYYLEDLDVTGKDSLYHLLDFSYLKVAKNKLLERLCHPLETKEEISERQEMFQDLKGRAISYLVEEGTLSKKERQPLSIKDVVSIPKMPLYLKMFSILYPVVTLFGFQFRPFIYYWMLFGIVFSGMHFRFWNEAYRLTAHKVEALEAYTKLIKHIEKEGFKSNALVTFQKQLLLLAKQKKNLEIIDQLLKFRFNPLLMVILNALCFYDGILYLILEKQEEASYLLEIQEALASYSSLCSMCMWFEIKENTVFPQFSNQLKATNLKHPLMVSEKAVGANFAFDDGAVVITGSNMAGKTTFMRSIGLNLVLFYCGLSVDATLFEAPILQIYTSMRVADRTQEGISTFYGELLRVKEMVQNAKKKKPAIYLIDEIFKGTNLKDRIIGAKATIEKLTYEKAFLFVSTHDEALCEHEHVSITNVHFEESYVDNKVVFDYQLKQGIAKTTNAKYLMKMIGLLE